MNLQDLYYMAGGTAFHHEITEDIAIAYLWEKYEELLTENEDYSILENRTCELEDEIQELQSEISSAEDEIGELQSKIEDYEEAIRPLQARSYRLCKFLENLDLNYNKVDLMPADIPTLIEVLEEIA